MIFYDSKSDIFYWKDEYSVVPEGSRRTDDDAKDYYIDNRETLKINLDNIPGDIITVEGIKQHGVDIDTLRAVKLAETNAACEAAIHAGFNFETSGGTKHFSLTEHDQMEMQDLLTRDLPEYEYHADGEPYEAWDKESFLWLVDAARQHKTLHRQYCNRLRAYIKQAPREALFEIKYGMELSE